MTLRAARAWNPANVGITGGTIANATVSGTTNAVYTLGRTGIPFIGLSSGSVAANGAISAITALPIAYPNAYCWFPANILATVKAAGWYYCTFSTTTAGVAFLDTYTSGVPTIPATPVAVTDGKGAFTGDTGEEFGPTFTVPANALGPNGMLRVSQQISQTSNANTKNVRVRYSGNAGTIMSAQNVVSTVHTRNEVEIVNRGATNVQISHPTSNQVGGWQSQAGPGTTAAVDTTASTTVVTSLQRATATDNLVLEYVSVEVLYAP